MGYILHSRPYRESSLIVELFTEADGRIAAVARGIKKNKVWQGLAQPFRKLQINFNGRHDLKTLSQMEAACQSNNLAGLPLYCGYYVNELMLKMLPAESVCESLFSCYEHTIKSLASMTGQKSSILEPCLREFEFSLFCEMGKELDFSTESGNGKFVSPEKEYWINFDYGISSIALTDAITVQGKTLLAIADREWHAGSLAGAKAITRFFIDRLLHTKTLHSRKMIRDYIEVISE